MDILYYTHKPFMGNFSFHPHNFFYQFNLEHGINVGHSLKKKKKNPKNIPKRKQI